MEDFFRAGGLHAVLREVQDLLDPTALTVTGTPLVEHLGDAADLGSRGDPPAQRTAAGARRHRGAVRQPRPGRRGDQTGCRVRAPAQASRPRGGVRLHRGHARAHRRPGPGRRRRLGADPARLRAEGISRHARGREHAAPDQAAAAGRARHGAHLRRSHERHGVRHRRAARDARGRGGRPARARPHRRLRHPRRRRATSRHRHSRGRAGARAPDAATVDAYAKPTRGWERLYVETVQQANTGADLDFLLGSSGDQVSRESH